MPKGIKGFQKGEGGRKKNSKNKATLLKEERRAIFDEKISQKWEETIDKLPPVYIADQFLGKAPEELIFKGAIQIDSDIAKKNNVIAPPTKDNSER